MAKKVFLTFILRQLGNFLIFKFKKMGGALKNPMCATA